MRVSQNRWTDISIASVVWLLTFTFTFTSTVAEEAESVNKGVKEGIESKESKESKERISLFNGIEIIAPVLSDNGQRIIIDLGHDVLRIPTESIASRAAFEQNESDNAPHIPA